MSATKQTANAADGASTRRCAAAPKAAPRRCRPANARHDAHSTARCRGRRHELRSSLSGDPRVCPPGDGAQKRGPAPPRRVLMATRAVLGSGPACGETDASYEGSQETSCGISPTGLARWSRELAWPAMTPQSIRSPHSGRERDKALPSERIRAPSRWRIAWPPRRTCQRHVAHKLLATAAADRPRRFTPCAAAPGDPGAWPLRSGPRRAPYGDFGSLETRPSSPRGSGPLPRSA